MVTVHELGALASDSAGADVQLLPQPKKLTTEEVVLVRCPTCEGLRGVSVRHAGRYSGMCRDCARGNIVPRWTFCTFWVERFTEEEIEEMAQAMWG